jgi:sporulation protein YlmC with PRC-barrel domain
MARHADEHGQTTQPSAVPKLVKLSDSEFRLQDRASDVRGLAVFNQNGEQLGSVEDFYVDTVEREVRFLEVGAGGFLGLGEKHFLIPMEAVTDTSGGGVTIEQSREKVEGSPELDTKGVPEDAYQQEVYDYYGYPNPRSPYPEGA